MVFYTYSISLCFILFYTVTIFNSTDILPQLNTMVGGLLGPKPKKLDEITHEENIAKVK
jgi:hypothetical protein